MYCSFSPRARSQRNVLSPAYFRGRYPIIVVRLRLRIFAIAGARSHIIDVGPKSRGQDQNVEIAARGVFSKCFALSSVTESPADPAIMERISSRLHELDACLTSLARSTNAASERCSLKECQQIIRHCILIKPPSYVDRLQMEQEIRAQVLWVKTYHTLVLEEAQVDRLGDYFEEIVQGVKALAESYSICLENQDWTTVSRKQRPLTTGNTGQQRQEASVEEVEGEGREEILPGHDKFWYY
jgi:hypothetical protein